MGIEIIYDLCLFHPIHSVNIRKTLKIQKFVINPVYFQDKL
jgi:hypothetical protein